MAALTQCPSSAALRPGHCRGGAPAAALRQPLAARAPAAVQGRRRALVVLSATHKASALRPRGARQPKARAKACTHLLTLDEPGRRAAGAQSAAGTVRASTAAAATAAAGACPSAPAL